MGGEQESIKKGVLILKGLMGQNVPYDLVIKNIGTLALLRPLGRANFLGIETPLAISGP